MLVWLLIGRAICLFKILFYWNDDDDGNNDNDDNTNIFMPPVFQALGQALYAFFFPIESALTFL